MVNRWEISNWINNLRSEDITIQKTSVNALGFIAKDGGAKDIVEEKGIAPLVHCLSNSDAEIRGKAIWTLGNIAKGGWSKEIVKEKGIAPLVYSLSDNDGYVRGVATWALGNIVKDGWSKDIVEEKGISPLLRSLSDNSVYVRQNAAWALGNIAKSGMSKHIVEEKGIAPLVHVLYDSDAEVRRKMTDTLGFITKDGWNKEVVEEKGIAPLIYSISDSDAEIRGKAIWALGNIAKGGWSKEIVKERGIPSLIQSLSDNDGYVRGVATWALGNIANDGWSKDIVEENGIAPMIRNLSDKDVYVRQNAAWVLGNIAKDGWSAYIVEDKGVAALIQCLSDEDATVRGNAIRSLGYLASGGSRGVLDAVAISKIAKLRNDSRKIMVLESTAKGYEEKTVGEIAIEVLESIKRDLKEEYESANMKLEEGERLVELEKYREAEDLYRDTGAVYNNIKKLTEGVEENVVDRSELKKRIEICRQRAAVILEYYPVSDKLVKLKKLEEMIEEYEKSVKKSVKEGNLEELRATGAKLDKSINETIPDIAISIGNMYVRNRRVKLKMQITNNGKSEIKELRVELKVPEGEAKMDNRVIEVGDLKAGEVRETEIRFLGMIGNEIAMEAKATYRDALGRSFEKEYRDKECLYIEEDKSQTEKVETGALQMDVPVQYEKTPGQYFHDILGESYQFVGDKPVHESRQSVVWKAKRRRKDGSIEEQVVVVKYPITAGDVGRRFLKEAETHKKLKHSGIAQVYDYDNTHIEMEWIEGDNLREYVKKRPREEVLAGVFYDCIDSLLYAWKMHKVVNTDLKPEHIIIVGGNKVKLIDWGGCFRMGSISRSDELVYTPQWAAPELLKGGKFPNEKTMTCILGRIMYWAYTGIEPEKEDIGKDLESSEELKDNPEIKELIMDCVKGEQEKRIGLIEIAERLNDLYNLGKDVEQLRAYRRADRKQGIVINETRKLIEEYEEKNVVKEISEVLEDEDIREILKERMEGDRKLKELYEQIKGDLEECMERGQELNDRMKENINSFFEKLNK